VPLNLVPVPIDRETRLDKHPNVTGIVPGKRERDREKTILGQ
jgi:hypothetical protein